MKVLIKMATKFLVNITVPYLLTLKMGCGCKYIENEKTQYMKFCRKHLKDFVNSGVDYDRYLVNFRKRALEGEI